MRETQRETERKREKHRERERETERERESERESKRMKGREIFLIKERVSEIHSLFNIYSFVFNHA